MLGEQWWTLTWVPGQGPGLVSATPPVILMCTCKRPNRSIGWKGCSADTSDGRSNSGQWTLEKLLQGIYANPSWPLYLKLLENSAPLPLSWACVWKGAGEKQYYMSRQDGDSLPAPTPSSCGPPPLPGGRGFSVPSPWPDQARATVTCKHKGELASRVARCQHKPSDGRGRHKAGFNMATPQAAALRYGKRDSCWRQGDNITQSTP